MAKADALRESHGRLPAILGSPSSILIVLDPFGTVLLWNSGAVRAFGIAEEAIVGKPFTAARIVWSWERVLQIAPGGVSLKECRVVQPFTRGDGRPGVAVLMVKPQFDRDGQLSGCLWLGCDSSQPAPEPPPARPAVPRPPTREATPAAGHQVLPPGRRGIALPDLTPRSGVPLLPFPSTKRDQTTSAPDLTPRSGVPLLPVTPGTQRPPARIPTPLPEAARKTERQAAIAEALAKFPVHVTFLDAHLQANGDDIEQWRFLNIEETRLDEDGMELMFTLTRRYPQQGFLRRRVLVKMGELVSVKEA